MQAECALWSSAGALTHWAFRVVLSPRKFLIERFWMLKNLNIAVADKDHPAAGLESVQLTLSLIELLASATHAKG